MMKLEQKTGVLLAAALALGLGAGHAWAGDEPAQADLTDSAADEQSPEIETGDEQDQTQDQAQDEEDTQTQAPMDAESEYDSTWEYLSARYDADEDGQITQEEYDREGGDLTRLDANEDGVVTAADFERRRRGRGRRGERPRRPEAPSVGEVAPDFTLMPPHGEEGDEVTLSALAGNTPVALIFGSYT